MGTKDFNIFDKLIASLRLSKVKRYINKDDIVMDFGCGAQSYLLNSSKEIIKKGYGVDYDVDESQDEKIILKKFRFVDKFDFDNNFFNKIYLLAVLEHIPLDIVDVLFKEFGRVLNENGRIVMTTPTPASKPVLEFLALNLKVISSKEILDHKKYYDKSDIYELAERNGFKVEEYNKFQFGLNSVFVFSKK